MLDVAMLKAMPPDTIFATGVESDMPGGLHMTGSGKLLRWVAVRGGGYHDWSLYCHFAEHNIYFIQRSGEKVCRDEHIKKLVPCDDEAFSLYRF